MGAFTYGWDQDTSLGDAPAQNQKNPLNLGGAVGAQVNSQTAGQGAGITPMMQGGANMAQSFAPTYDYGFKDSMTGGGVSGMGTPSVPTNALQTQTEPQKQIGQGTAVSGSPQAQTQDFTAMLQKVQSAASPQDAAVAQDQLARNLQSTLSAAGHDVKWKDQQTLTVDGREYTVAGGNTPAGARNYSASSWMSQVSQPDLPSDLESWRPTQDTLYTPGDINFNDIENFSRQSLMGEMEGGETNQLNNQLLNDILRNPTALNDQVVDTMKAQQKNLLSEQQKQEEEDLRGFGAQSGISDSRWLANEMASSRRARDVGVAKAAQDVDIKAAETRMADKQKAAQLGLAAGQQHAQNVQQATSQSLARSAAMGDRMNLRESVKQAAAQLRISQDQVMSNFIGERQRNLLTKYGIDLGAQIDADKLNEQSAEFKEDLMFKMQQLEQTMAMQGRAIGSQEKLAGNELQYKYDVFNQNNWDKDWERQWLMSQFGD